VKLECRGGCVETLTLADIIERYNIDPSNSMLKLGCEVCEYNVIPGDYNRVRLFKEVIVEYHRGYRGILEVMRRDFTCRHEAKHLFSDLAKQGLLYYVKRGSEDRRTM
jgi:hypothetical protein